MIEGPVRHDDPAFASMVRWDVSPDGTQVAGTSVAFERLILYDLARAVSRVEKRIGPEAVQRPQFLPGGAVLLSTALEDMYSLVRRDGPGDERVLWRRNAWIASIVPLDDDRILLSTVTWQFRLSLFEMP